MLEDKIYPTFLKRISAAGIDIVLWTILFGIMFFVIFAIISFFIGVVGGVLNYKLSHDAVEVILNTKANELVESLDIVSIISGFISICIFSLFECSYWQATPGKKFFKILVTDSKGKQLNFKHAFVRNIFKMVTILTAGFGYLLIFFTKKHQALHDKISSTLVIKE